MTKKGRLLLSFTLLVFFLILEYFRRPYPLTTFIKVEAIIAMTFIVIAAYIFLYVVSLSLSERHTGWKRLSLLLGIIGGITGGIYGYDGSKLTIDDFLEVTGHAAIGIVFGLSIIIIGRWIANGFINHNKEQ